MFENTVVSANTHTQCLCQFSCCFFDFCTSFKQNLVNYRVQKCGKILKDFKNATIDKASYDICYNS